MLPSPPVQESGELSSATLKALISYGPGNSSAGEQQKSWPVAAIFLYHLPGVRLSGFCRLPLSPDPKPFASPFAEPDSSLQPVLIVQAPSLEIFLGDPDPGLAGIARVGFTAPAGVIVDHRRHV